jgi:hypothetical protein
MAQAQQPFWEFTFERLCCSAGKEKAFREIAPERLVILSTHLFDR